MASVNATTKETPTSLLGFYNFIFTDLSDPRTNNWFLISSPLPGLTIIGLYLYFVNSFGPKMMRHRKPFELKRTLLVYNVFQVVISVYIFYIGLTRAWLYKYSWRCEPVDWSTSTEAMEVAAGVYMYFLAKLTELLDTIFFVLRKKHNQVTFLHLYHHTVMPMISWGATKYFPGGHGTFIGLINSFVHIIMYTYYLLAAMGPSLQKYLWWKKYITTLQLLQFCIAFIHSMQLLFIDCGYPRWSTCFTLPNAIFFYYLFYDFYNKSYDKGSKGDQQKALEKESTATTAKDVGPECNGNEGKTINSFANDQNHSRTDTELHKKRQ